MSAIKDIGYSPSSVSAPAAVSISRAPGYHYLTFVPFPVGVSILVSGFFAVVAFNASAVKKYWAGRSKRRSPKRDRVERPQLDRRSLTLEGSSGSDTLV
ncbi:hypothetical protein N7468_010583 [Penicillium chermesinum]|uniref:Uncharacterized protein n=1 Tax=Penicillium chermesinum TaxID=63820 RepID=A0A9W9N7W9_9EURO|nr:uncharacterized protein N7468_010583 [Penicillium chermesinum]KAJ5214904.1 hypothetical protein N7468_010583 [Penicillium chermesinum]